MEHCLILVIFYRNIIKDEPSDEESPVTLEDNLITNYGNNQVLGNWKFIYGGGRDYLKCSNIKNNHKWVLLIFNVSKFKLFNVDCTYV